MATIIQLLIVLGIMVLVHEFGHFAVAKLCGIRVEVFSIGFGKRLFGFRRGDTEYQIAFRPLRPMSLAPRIPATSTRIPAGSGSLSHLPALSRTLSSHLA
jgi:hypothetical protein